MQLAMNRSGVKDTICDGALCLALLAGVPVCAVILFALRPLLLLGAVVAVIIAFILSAVSARFRAWADEQTRPLAICRGLRLARDVALHRGHGWVRFEREAVVGANDLVLSALGPVEEIIAPGAGRRVGQGDPLFRLRRGGRTVDIPSPISGLVLRTNQALQREPTRINDRPFGAGWVVRLRPDRPREDAPALMEGWRARRWFRGETDRALTCALPGADAARPIVPKAGQPLHAQIDELGWRRLRTSVFTGRGSRTEIRA